ncbi:MAG: hypothetical protein JW939_02680 [Candidatus Thermoplasmatota archaeon]|nr:hypothetical protein [Candidatus Thermoplasmatota archaeon]
MRLGRKKTGGRSKKRSRTSRRKKDTVVEEAPIREENEERETQVTEQAIPPVPDEAEDRDLVLEALNIEDRPPRKGSETVMIEQSTDVIMRDMISHALKDGTISDDEMSMLRALKEKFKVDDVTFDRIMSETIPPDMDTEQEPDYPLEGELPEPTPLAEDLEDDDEDLDTDIEMPPVIENDPETPPDEPQPDIEPDRDQYRERMETSSKVETGPEPDHAAREARNIISFTSYVRDTKKPLGESFDLTKKEGANGSFPKQCPRCGARMVFSPEEGGGTCPNCGEKMSPEEEGTPDIRKLLDRARSAFKVGNRNTATELYTIVLSMSPRNKEAQFYLQKLHHGPKGKKPVIKADARNIDFIQSLIPRLDQLLHGGVPSGSQVLLKGPAFSGKEVVLDKLMACSLSQGIPVIYVSSNRAMKEVMHGIIRQVPEFRMYNQEGLVRMYDLFSKHMDGRVLKEGHRIFNIEDREDFKRFQMDLVSLMEELVSEFHGGVLLINSLSPLISRTDPGDLMKFLQVLIARSKSYRFTNILDMATGVHPESMENSIEYLMDGILEFRERDNRKSLRLKGFRHGVLSRDWIDYRHTDIDFHLVGPFQEERIL